MKIDKLEDYLNKNEYNPKMEKKFKFTLIYKNAIYAIALAIMLVLSLIFYRRVVLFASIFRGFTFLITLLYYSSFAASIGLLIYLLYRIYRSIGDDDFWRLNCYKLYKKLDIWSFICNCIAMFLFVVTFIVTPCNVSGDSMSDTYLDKDKVLCSPIHFGLDNNDVIIFDASNYSYNGKMELYIKRIVASEGDDLYYKNQTLYVNDKPVCSDMTENSYLKIILSAGYESINDNVVVPENKLVVLGDNRLVSYDSRSFGMIDEKDVFGKLIFPVKNLK